MVREYFRILAPFTRREDVKLLKDAGADELYCGYVTEELTKRWPSAFNILNRRGEGISFENYDTFRKAIEQANKYNLPVYVTINGLYTPEQYPFLLELVEKVERLEGVKGIIVVDLGLLLILRKNKFNKEIHISVGGTCFNSSTAGFFYNLGAKRIVLDRHLTSYEIESIIKESKSEIDFEIFILASACGGFIDGFCTFFHCREDIKKDEIRNGYFLCPSYNTEQSEQGCNFYFNERLAEGNFKTISVISYKKRKDNLKFQRKKYVSEGCRICDLYGFKNYPIKSLKIVGRGEGSMYVVKLVKLVSEALSYLTRDCITKMDYQRKCRNLFSKIIFDNKRRCTKFDCYFSPHWVEK